MKLIDVIILLILVGLMTFVIRYMIRNKKQGKSFNGCSGNCRECAISNCEKHLGSNEPE